MTDVLFLDWLDVPLRTPDGVDWQLDWANHLAVGGDDQANLIATGPTQRLWGLRDLLGYHVIIYDERGDVAFHGLIETIRWQTGVKERSLSLRNMANRVAVAYTTTTNAGQERGTTAWQEDATSITRFGRKERLLVAIDASAGAAAAKATTAINRGIAKPQAGFALSGGDGVVATLECIGLHHTLDWVYYANGAGQINHQSTDTRSQPLGQALTSTALGVAGNAIHDVNGTLALEDPGVGLTVAGSASNDGNWVSDSQDRRTGKTYSAATIFFDAADDIHDDTGQGFGFIETDDYIAVSGAANGANNGYKRVTSADATHLTVNPATIVTAAAGPTITIQRGTVINIAGDMTDEFPGNSVTVTVHGTKLFQTFTLPTNESWTAAEVALSVGYAGTPGDSLRVSLTTVSNGNPGTTLDSSTLIYTTFDEESAEYIFPLSNTVTLNPGVTYGLLIERTGSNSPANYYKVDLDLLGSYGGGALKLYNGSGWLSSTFSLNFRVSGAQETTTQILDIVGEAGQFMTSLDLQVASGIATNQYRDGDRTALEEILELIALGTASGDRLLFDITPQRVLRLRAQPASQADDWRISDSGDVIDNYSHAVRNARRLAGRWLQSDDVPPGVGYLSDLRTIFVEAAEMPAAGPPTLTSTGEEGAWDL